LDYSTVTLGVAVDVFTPKKKKDLKKEKESKENLTP
jgi:hypothetical protein